MIIAIKKSVALACLLGCLSTGVIAQEIKTISKTMSVHRVITEKTVVKDTLGNVIPYHIWHELAFSGNYGLRPLVPVKDGKPNEDPDMEYVLLRLSEREKAEKISRAPEPQPSPYFTAGEVFKPFKIKDIKGDKFDVKDWAGKTVVLNFWFINCPPCRQEMPELNKIVDKYTGNPNVIFIGIALDEAYLVKDFIKTNPFNYRLVGDGRYYADMFKIHTYPTHVVIDKTGKIVFHTTGFGTGTVKWLAKAIDDSDAGLNDTISK